MSSRSINCLASCPAGMQAAFHIERAAMLLNAALEINNLSGAVYRNTLSVAMTALGNAVAALQTSTREVAHG